MDENEESAGKGESTDETPVSGRPVRFVQHDVGNDSRALQADTLTFFEALEAAPAAAAAAAVGVAAVREGGATARTWIQEQTKRKAIDAAADHDGGPKPLAAEQAPDTD